MFYNILMSNEYRNEQNIRNNTKINELLNNMPEFLEDFHTHLDSRNRSTNTILGYMYEINVFLRFMAVVLKKENVKDIQVTDLDKIRMTQIEKYIAESEDGIKLSETARRRKLSVLKTMYKYYLAIGAIKNNPTLLVEGPKLHERDVVKLSDSEVSALLNCIQNQDKISEHAKAYNKRMVDRDMAIIMVLLGTGMRVSELVGLNLSDIDTTEDHKVYFSIIRKGGDYDKVRVISPVYNAVADYIEFSRPLLLSSTDENALFISTQGKRISVNAVQKMLKKYCKAAGLSDKYSPHKMRATFATKVYAETKDIYAIKDALHHSNIDTSKHYISDKEARIDAAAEAASTFFS